MPELFVTSGPNLGKTYAVESGAQIGRSPDCTVQLTHKSISRQHAHLEVDGGRWALIDDGSRNGVFLDEKRVQRIELSDGLEFKVGELYLRFRATPVETKAVVEPETEEEYEEEISLDDDFDAPEIVMGGGAGAVAPRKIETPKPVAPKPAARQATSAARERQTAELAATQVSKRPDDGVQARGSTGRVLQYQRIENRDGFFSADLSQYPLWIKLPIFVLVIALAVGGAWLAFQGSGIVMGDPDESFETEFEEP